MYNYYTQSPQLNEHVQTSHKLLNYLHAKYYASTITYTAGLHFSPDDRSHAEYCA